MSQFNPNPHEVDFEADMSAELGLAPSTSPNRPRITAAQNGKVRAAIRNLFSSPEVKAMSGGEREILKTQIKRLFARIRSGRV